MAKFKPKTVYVIYIASTPEKVWQALTIGRFHPEIFLGPQPSRLSRSAAALSSLQLPDGRVNVRGKVVEWSIRREG